MKTVSVQELQEDPATLLDRVEAGECVLVSRAGRAVAELRPLPRATRELRPFGLAAGAFVVPEDFDAALPEDVLREFEGQ